MRDFPASSNLNPLAVCAIQSFCFALAGLGAFAVANLLVWGSLAISAGVGYAALAFGVLHFLHSRGSPLTDARDLVGSMGTASLVLWIGGYIVTRGAGGRNHMWDYSRSSVVLIILVVIASVVAGLAYVLAIGRWEALSYGRRWSHAISAVTFAIALGSAGASLGASVGLLSSAAMPARFSGSGPDALFVGALIGLCIMPVAYSILGNARHSGWLAPATCLTTVVLGTVCASVTGPAAAALVPIGVLGLAIGARAYARRRT